MLTPELESLFAVRGWKPFAYQREVWDAYARGESGLVHAPTGTGKTWAVWLPVLAEALREPSEGDAAHGRVLRSTAAPLRALWVTPLRALAADTETALRGPLDASSLRWTLESRTGDTTASGRARQRARLPTALITTPESLSLLLARDDAETLFATLQLVVVDEWHELLASKRGVQVELALARLRSWRPPLRVWGLSATLGNLEVAAAALGGVDGDGVVRPIRIVQGSVPKAVIIDAVIPRHIDRFPWAGHLGTTLINDVIEIIESSRTTLIFTNTRSQTELWFQAITTRRPDLAPDVALHHGSIGKKAREIVEDRLKRGSIRAVVCTSSLDLGVDFSPVDRVVQVGSPKGVSRLLQRAGRSGHAPGAASRITCVPTHAFELVEVAAVREAALAGLLEAREPVPVPLDVLAQHLVTCAVGGGFHEQDLQREVRTAWAYRHLTDVEWDWTLDFVVRGGTALHAYPEYNKLSQHDDGRWRASSAMVTRRHRMSIGTIVSDASVTVKFLRGATIGTVEESFIARLRSGDRFLFGGRSLEFVRSRDMIAYVRRASSTGGSVARWMGARMPLSSELASAVRRKLAQARRGVFDTVEMEAVREIMALQAARSEIPDTGMLLIERCRTRDGCHIFIFPFGGRLVHEGLAALVAWRLSQHRALSFSFAINDYGFELLSAAEAPLEEAVAAGLFATTNLAHDITASLNAAEMARRQFREIARVAGLVFQGYPGAGKSVRQVQASSGLLYDVFARYDPGNLLLDQATREVLERQLERTRLVATLEDIDAGPIIIRDVARPTPLAFPLMVDRFRQRLSSESLAERVRRMTIALERND